MASERKNKAVQPLLAEAARRAAENAELTASMVAEMREKIEKEEDLRKLQELVEQLLEEAEAVAGAAELVRRLALSSHSRLIARAGLEGSPISPADPFCERVLECIRQASKGEAHRA